MSVHIHLLLTSLIIPKQLYMSSGRPRGVENKSGHPAGGARAGSGRKRLEAISLSTGNSIPGELGKSFLCLTAVNLLFNKCRSAGDSCAAPERILSHFWYVRYLFIGNGLQESWCLTIPMIYTGLPVKISPIASKTSKN